MSDLNFRVIIGNFKFTPTVATPQGRHKEMVFLSIQLDRKKYKSGTKKLLNTASGPVYKSKKMGGRSSVSSTTNDFEWKSFIASTKYTVENLNVLESKSFFVGVYTNPKRPEIYGQVGVDLYTVATGPKNYFLDVKGLNGQTIGKVFFSVIFQNLADVLFVMKRVNLTKMQFPNKDLKLRVYMNTHSEAPKIYSTEFKGAQNMYWDKAEWQEVDFPPLSVYTSLEGILKADFRMEICSLGRVLHNLSLPLKYCITDSSKRSFCLAGNVVGKYEYEIEFEFATLPGCAQMMGGQLTEEGIMNSVMIRADLPKPKQKILHDSKKQQPPAAEPQLIQRIHKSVSKGKVCNDGQSAQDLLADLDMEMDLKLADQKAEGSLYGVNSKGSLLPPSPVVLKSVKKKPDKKPKKVASEGRFAKVSPAESIDNSSTKKQPNPTDKTFDFFSSSSDDFFQTPSNNPLSPRRARSMSVSLAPGDLNLFDTTPMNQDLFSLDLAQDKTPSNPFDNQFKPIQQPNNPFVAPVQENPFEANPFDTSAPLVSDKDLTLQFSAQPNTITGSGFLTLEQQQYLQNMQNQMMFMNLGNQNTGMTSPANGMASPANGMTSPVPPMQSPDLFSMNSGVQNMANFNNSAPAVPVATQPVDPFASLL